MKRDERGASAVEYGMVLAGIAAILAASFLLFGGTVAQMFADSCTSIHDSMGGTPASCL